MSKYDEIKIGDKFGRLSVSGPIIPVGRKTGRGRRLFLPCQCECGQRREVEAYKLTTGWTKSCGCLQKEHINQRNTKNQENAAYSLVPMGERYGSLTVKSLLHRKDATGKIRHYFLCACVCGVEKPIDVNNLISGKSTNCGCVRDENNRKRSTKHGLNPAGKRERLYRIWLKMRGRCEDFNNNRYSTYGGRGITVCKEWQDFSSFCGWALVNGYASDLSIDRIDNDLPYYPDNCRWATKLEQANNRSTNAWIEAWGEEKTIAEWSRDTRCSVSARTLRYRLQRAFWEPEQAISEPSRS